MIPNFLRETYRFVILGIASKPAATADFSPRNPDFHFSLLLIFFSAGPLSLSRITFFCSHYKSNNAVVILQK